MNSRTRPNPSRRRTVGGIALIVATVVFGVAWMGCPTPVLPPSNANAPATVSSNPADADNPVSDEANARLRELLKQLQGHHAAARLDELRATEQIILELPQAEVDIEVLRHFLLEQVLGEINRSVEGAPPFESTLNGILAQFWSGAPVAGIEATGACAWFHAVSEYAAEVITEAVTPGAAMDMHQRFGTVDARAQSIIGTVIDLLDRASVEAGRPTCPDHVSPLMSVFRTLNREDEHRYSPVFVYLSQVLVAMEARASIDPLLERHQSSGSGAIRSAAWRAAVLLGGTELLPRLHQEILSAMATDGARGAAFQAHELANLCEDLRAAMPILVALLLAQPESLGPLAAAISAGLKRRPDIRAHGTWLLDQLRAQSEPLIGVALLPATGVALRRTGDLGLDAYIDERVEWSRAHSDSPLLAGQDLHSHIEDLIVAKSDLFDAQMPLAEFLRDLRTGAHPEVFAHSAAQALGTIMAQRLSEGDYLQDETPQLLVFLRETTLAYFRDQSDPHAQQVQGLVHIWATWQIPEVKETLQSIIDETTDNDALVTYCREALEAHALFGRDPEGREDSDDSDEPDDSDSGGDADDMDDPDTPDEADGADEANDPDDTDEPSAPNAPRESNEPGA